MPAADLSGVRAIIFDAEGVVIDTESLWDESQRLLLARRDISYERERVKHLMAGRSLTDGARILIDEYGLGEDPVALAAERRDIARKLFAGGVDYIPGYCAFFERLKKTRLSMCIATSMEPALFAIVDAGLGLRAGFAGRIYFTADVDGRAKPDPAIFLFAAKRLKRSPGECLVIEDSPHGVAAARAAGMRCVALTTSFDAEKLQSADWVYDSFEQIPEIEPDST